MASMRTIRRTWKIWRQVQDALCPFAQDGALVAFDKNGGIYNPAVVPVWNTPSRQARTRRGATPREPKGSRIIRTRAMEKPLSFFASTCLELPRDTMRRFVYYCGGGPEPSEEEFNKFRRLLLGTAKRKLLREQVRRIKDLPSLRLPGPGRMSRINDNERNEVIEEFKRLKVSGDFDTTTQIVDRLAQRYGCKRRNMWKILSQTRQKTKR